MSVSDSLKYVKIIFFHLTSWCYIVLLLKCTLLYIKVFRCWVKFLLEILRLISLEWSDVMIHIYCRNGKIKLFFGDIILFYFHRIIFVNLKIELFFLRKDSICPLLHKFESDGIFKNIEKDALLKTKRCTRRSFAEIIVKWRMTSNW